MQKRLSKKTDTGIKGKINNFEQLLNPVTLAGTKSHNGT